MDRSRDTTGEIARRAAWRVVQIGGKTWEALRQACEETPAFATVAYSTVVRYAREIRNDEDLAAAAEATKHDPSPLGTVEPSNASMQCHSAETLNVATTELPLEERKRRWIAEARLWKEKIESGETRGLKAIMKHCSNKFGTDAAFNKSTVTSYVKEGRIDKGNKKMGKPRSLPEDVQKVLAQFIKLRSDMQCPVSKSIVLDYTQRLIEGSIHAKNFAKIGVDGAIKRNADGGIVWCPIKWNNWYYRHFLKENGMTGITNRRLLGANQAKGRMSDTILDHYRNFEAAVLELAFCKPNLRYDENEKDEEGVPKEPKLLWCPGKRDRCFLLDETKVDGKILGDGGHRAGRIECCHCEDASEVVASQSSRTVSAIGGSSARFESLPFFCCSPDSLDLDALMRINPKPKFHGRIANAQGTTNANGSIDEATFLQFIEHLESCVDPPVSHENPAILVCDDAHISSSILVHLAKVGWRLVLRRRSWSDFQQAEDLISFHRLENKRNGLCKLKERGQADSYFLEDRLSLNFEEIIIFLGVAWRRAFSEKNNEIAWKKSGLFPFTMASYWKQLAKEKGAKKRPAAAAFETASSSEENGIPSKPSSDLLAERKDGGESENDDEPFDLSIVNNLTSDDLWHFGATTKNIFLIKVADVMDHIQSVKTATAPRLKKLCEKSNIPYTNAGEAKVDLLHALERHYNVRIPLSWVPKKLRSRFVVRKDLQATASSKKQKENQVPDGGGIDVFG